MELVHAFPGQGVCSVWSFARAAGVADGAFAVALPQLSVKYVVPQVWQKFFRLQFGIPKEQEFDSRRLAVQLFPAYVDFFKRKTDHNSADAVLLCVWQAHQLSLL
jgi:hypothetical protein